MLQRQVPPNPSKVEIPLRKAKALFGGRAPTVEQLYAKNPAYCQWIAENVTDKDFGDAIRTYIAVASSREETEYVSTFSEPNLFRLIRQQREGAAREYYLKNAGRITGEWQPTNKPCSHFPDCDHNQVKFKGKDGRWYIICPVKYYLLLGSRALWESGESPSRELFQQLLGKEKPSGH